MLLAHQHTSIESIACDSKEILKFAQIGLNFTNIDGFLSCFIYLLEYIENPIYLLQFLFD